MEFIVGDILTAQTEAIVNTVNCVGVMGRGLALQFKRTFPENFRLYHQACERGEVELGHMCVVPTGQLTFPRYIINFPTKGHWRSKSRLRDIDAGFGSLVEELQARGIRSVSIPPSMSLVGHRRRPARAAVRRCPR